MEYENLETMAKEALEEYHRAVYPQWASEVLGLIKEHRIALAHNAFLEALLKKRAADMEAIGAGGMTLRDYFAAKAMQGFIAADWFSDARNFDLAVSQLADESYLVADAMFIMRRDSRRHHRRSNGGKAMSNRAMNVYLLRKGNDTAN